MKIKTLIAATAIATASTAAVADQVNVTTDNGEIVMVEKNQASLAALGAYGPIAIMAFIAAVAAAGGS